MVPIKVLCLFLFFYMRATCTTHPMLLDGNFNRLLLQGSEILKDVTVRITKCFLLQELFPL